MKQKKCYVTDESIKIYSLCLQRSCPAIKTMSNIDWVNTANNITCFTKIKYFFDDVNDFLASMVMVSTRLPLSVIAVIVASIFWVQ